MAGDKHMLKSTFLKAVHGPERGHEEARAGKSKESMINPLFSPDFVFPFDEGDWSKPGLAFNPLGLTFGDGCFSSERQSSRTLDRSVPGRASLTGRGGKMLSSKDGIY